VADNRSLKSASQTRADGAISPVNGQRALRFSNRADRIHPNLGVEATMSLALHLKVVGLLMLALAAAHFTFPRRFNWASELRRLSPLNRQIFIVHDLFIVLMLVMMGLLSLWQTAALLEPTALGRVMLAGLTLFWAVRLFVQFFVYDASLWRGNRFRTVMHGLFAGMWTYYTAVFACGWWWQMH